MLISPAYAQAAGAASQTDTLLTFLPMVAIFVVFYFLLIRPQQKKAKEARAMLDALEKGDESRHRRRHRRPHRQARRAVRDGRNRAQRRDDRAARGDFAAAAQGHDQGSDVTRRCALASRATRPAYMNRYPAWKYILIGIALAVGLLYTLPNFFPEVPAVQVSSSKATRQDRHRAARHGRGGAEGRRASRIAAPTLDSDRHQGPLRRSGHAAQGQGRRCRRSSATTTSSR